MRGKFITVEGIEGVGKSTNIDYLVSLLKERGIEAVRTREPGGTPMAERIREMLLAHDDEPLPDIAELLLFFAARALHIENKIRPALQAGKWVVCDRFTDASRAYQGYGRGQDTARLEQLAAWVQGGLEPDLTILLDAPATIGMQRAARRSAADRMEVEKQEFFDRIRHGYLELAKAHPGRFEVVDASQDLEQVQIAVGGAVARLFSNN